MGKHKRYHVLTIRMTFALAGHLVPFLPVLHPFLSKAKAAIALLRQRVGAWLKNKDKQTKCQCNKVSLLPVQELEAKKINRNYLQLLLVLRQRFRRYYRHCRL